MKKRTHQRKRRRIVKKQKGALFPFFPLIAGAIIKGVLVAGAKTTIEKARERKNRR